jgi:hypothetical protein
MKISKSLLAGLMVVGFAAAASAQTDVYICGSTAFRASVTKAIQDVFILSSGTCNVAWDGGGSSNPLYKASTAIMTGTYNGNAVFVHTYWTGSAAGLTDLSVPNQITKWMPDTVFTGAAAAAIKASGTSGINISGTYTAVSAYPTATMSDSFYDSIGKSIASEGATGRTYQTDINNLDNNGFLEEAGTDGETVVGVVPFLWVSGVQTSGTSPFTNMTQQAAAQLQNVGYISVSQMGITSDTNDFCFLIGRNEDSGTRIGAEAEAQLGTTLGTASFGQPVKQYYAIFTATNSTVSTDGTFSANPNDNITAGTPIQAGGAYSSSTNGVIVADIGLWPKVSPVNTESTLNWNLEGHSGQVSGGDVAGVLEAGNPLLLSGTSIDNKHGQPQSAGYISGASKCYLLGYLAASDAASVPTSGSNPGVYLSYNGVPYSPANIDNGSYTFWTFEHMYYTTSGANAISGVAQNMADAVADEVYTYDAQTNSSGVTTTTANPAISAKCAGLYLNNLQVTRTREGDPVFINY